jgi:hypothetical protein
MEPTFNYTGHGWEGKHYKATASDSSADLARHIRKQLKEQLPDCKFSVKKEDYSGGRRISVSLMSAPFAVFAEPNEDVAFQNQRNFTTDEMIAWWKQTIEKGHYQLNPYHIDSEYYLTEKGREVAKKMIQIVQDFNFDDSDGMIDYFHTNFYLHASIGKWNKPFQVT